MRLMVALSPEAWGWGEKSETPEPAMRRTLVSDDVRRRGYRRLPTPALGPLFDPAFEEALEEPFPEAAQNQPPLLVLGAGANGANNHIHLLEALQPLAGKIRVVALCGRRQAGDGG